MKLNQNMVAVIAGGASGMGAATTRLLAGLGVQVAIIDADKTAGQMLAAQTGAYAYHADVTVAAILQLIPQISNDLGPIRICVNCAGIAPAQRIVNRDGPMPLEQFKQVIDVNLIGSFNVMRVAAAQMMKAEVLNQDNERGVIINTASIAAYEGQLGQAAYSASKGGIVAMTLPAARELAQFGIRVNAIAPGLIRTPMVEKMPEKVQDNLQAQTLFPQRLGHAEEFAKLVLHIIENPMINGETIRLDGAVRLQAS